MVFFLRPPLFSSPLPNNIFRSKTGFNEIDDLFTLLIKNNIPTGINCVLNKNNFDQIEEIIKYAVEKGINEIEFLRLKPSGRGLNAYLNNKMTLQQNINLYPVLVRLAEQYKIDLKIDCSFVPMICFHNPDKELLEKTAVNGCEAGNILLGIRSNGQVSGCSFLNTLDLNVFQLKEKWQSDRNLKILREFENNMDEPCKSCEYLSICKGGCHAVSEIISQDIQAPDPDCPKVRIDTQEVKI